MNLPTDEYQGDSPQVFEPVEIALSDAQIEKVVRRTSGLPDRTVREFLLARIRRLERLSVGDKELEDNPLVSQSIVRGFMVLYFLSGTANYGVLEIASMAGISPSTTYRYLSTLKAVGLVKQSSVSRGYQSAITLENGRGDSITTKLITVRLSGAQVAEVVGKITQENLMAGPGLLRLNFDPAVKSCDALEELTSNTRLSRTLLRALMILRLLFLSGEQSLDAIRFNVDLHRSTTFRYLTTLVWIGWIERLGRGKYRLATGEKA